MLYHPLKVSSLSSILLLNHSWPYCVAVIKFLYVLKNFCFSYNPRSKQEAYQHSVLDYGLPSCKSNKRMLTRFLSGPNAGNLKVNGGNITGKVNVFQYTQTLAVKWIKALWALKKLQGAVHKLRQHFWGGVGGTKMLMVADVGGRGHLQCWRQHFSWNGTILNFKMIESSSDLP